MTDIKLEVSNFDSNTFRKIFDPLMDPANDCPYISFAGDQWWIECALLDCKHNGSDPKIYDNPHESKITLQLSKIDPKYI